MAFFSRQQTYLGLDIGTSSIKVVQLQQEEKGAASLVTYAAAGPMPVSPIIAEKDEDAIGQTATIIKDMLQKSGATATKVIAALPSLSVFSSVLTLPSLGGKELEQAILHAAQSYVPSPLKDVMLGWSVIDEEQFTKGAPSSTTPPVSDTASTADAQKMPRTRSGQEIFLTAAPKYLVQRYASVVERLSLKLVALEVESFPLSRSLLQDEKRPALLIDIGDRATNITVVNHSYLRLNQSIDMGGASITQALQRTLGVSLEEAEKRKYAGSLAATTGEGAQIANTMRPVVRDIIERAQNLRRLYEQKSQRAIGKVVLIGGGAHLGGLSQFWSEVSGIPTEVGNPWKGIRVPAQLTDRLQQLGPSFAVAVGLALREFDETE